MATLISQTLSFEKRNNLRDPSFSSYLSNTEDNFIVKLAEPSQEASPPKMTPHIKAEVQGHHFYAGRVKDIEEGEIDVFGAEKYFQGELEEESIRRNATKSFSTIHLQQNELNRVKSTQSSPGYLLSANICSENQNQSQNQNQKIKFSTPSVCSESSVNSQSVLLHKVPRNRASTKGRYVRNFLASLGCNCNDGAAVEVDEQSVEKGVCSKGMTRLPSTTTVDLVQEAKSMPWTEEEIHINLKREDCFSFPVLSSNPGMTQVQDVKSKLQEREHEKNQKLSMLNNNWDADSRREDQEIKIQSYGMDNYNDAASDASSDLFELESFSTNGMSSCMTPITCYAPSEASIQWSVVTASAANCSAFSDYKSKQNNLDQMVRIAKIGKTVEKDRQKRRPGGILSGCTSLKAVKVVENEYRTPGEKVIRNGHGRNEVSPITPAPIFRGESKLTGSDSARGHRGFSSCSLPQSHSPRFLYT